MNKMINAIKKAAKWYFEHAAETYVWYPSGMVPRKLSK